MTDSEEEHEVNSNFTVSRLAECALIISLGSVCGLKGIEKVRTRGKGKGKGKGVSRDLRHPPHPPSPHTMILLSHAYI